MVPPGGRADTDTSATRGYPRQPPGEEGDISGVTSPEHRAGVRPIRGDGGSPSGLADGRDTKKRPRYTMVGETGKFYESGVPRGYSPSGANINGDGATIKRGGGGYRGI